MTTDTGLTVPVGFDSFGIWFKKTFDLWAAQWKVWVLQSLIYSGIGFLINFVASPAFGACAGIVLFALLGPGMVHTALKQIRGESISTADIFSETGLFLGALLVALVTAVGLIGCIVGVFVTGGLTMLALPALVDRKMQISDAFKFSWDITLKNPMFFIVFHLALVLLVLAGAIGCGIGILATGAFPFIGMAVAYVEVTRAKAPAAPDEAVIDTPPPPTI